jgi:ribonuclease HI
MIQVWTDGSSNGRTGGATGWGWVIEMDGTPLHAGYGGRLGGTNNTAELQAAIDGLRALEKIILFYPQEDVVLVSDSKYTLGSASGRLSAVKNLEQVAELQGLFKKLCNETRWVKGHADEKFNIRCDSLAHRGKEEAKLKAKEEQC